MIRKIDSSFTDKLVNIEKCCFSHPASRENIKSSLENDRYEYVGFLINDILVGYGSVFIAANESYINNIAVLKEYRKQGIASEILMKILELSSDCDFVTLEVRESNLPAIALYQKHGFKQVAVRKNYYSEPVENAIIMTKYLEK